jgi:hypothetical protein
MLFAGGCRRHATPDQDDRTKLGGGLALKTPFGTFYAPNISPDPKAGIGGWSEADFVTALIKGTSPAGQHYYPVFPLRPYQNMALADVRDPIRLSQDPAGGGRKSRAHACRSRSASAAWWGMEIRVSRRRGSSPIRRNRRRGSAAPT